MIAYSTIEKQDQIKVIQNADAFEQHYIPLREKEKRIYYDEEIKHLPSITKQHPHYKEWKTRKHSAGKLISYLKRKKTQLVILETGCGNGWLCHQLSAINNASITGVDINAVELQQ